LDLSAAFDTVDHDILLDILHRGFGIEGVCHSWFRSYLSDRTQTFVFNNSSSSPFTLQCGVPQGSVLVPLQFISYTSDVINIFHKYGINYHLYADDKQLYKSSNVAEVSNLTSELSDCVQEVHRWCSSHRLQLNATKTELIWFGSKNNLNKLGSVDKNLILGNDVISPSSVVRDLGVSLDAELSLNKHVATVASSCFYNIRRLKQITKFVNRDLAVQLMSCFVLSRLDYCNSILA